MSLFRSAALLAQRLANATPLLAGIERLTMLDAAVRRGAPIIIVGCPRSGTTLLYEVITSCFRTAYPSNVASMFYRAPVLASAVAGAFVKEHNPRFESNLGYVNGLLAPSEAGALMKHWFTGTNPLAQRDPELVRRIAASLANVMGGPLVLKNLYLDSAFDLVFATFPECVILRMTRDERFTAQSILTARRREVGDHADWWGPRPKGFESVVGQSLPRQIAWQINQIEHSLDRLSSQEPVSERLLTCDYGELCSAPRSLMQRLSSFYRDVTGASLVMRGDIPDSFPIADRRTLPNPDWLELEAALSDYGLPKARHSQ